MTRSRSSRSRSRSPGGWRCLRQGEAQGSSPEVRTPTETRRRTAFVSLATEDYGRGALVMSASMRTRLPEDVDVVVFSDAELAVVPGVSVRELEDLPKVSPPQQAGEPLMPHFRFCWRKLGLWALEEYDVIFYLDSDMLAVGDVAGLLDFLPEEGQLGAVPSCECWRSESCNYTLGPREGPSKCRKAALKLRLLLAEASTSTQGCFVSDRVCWSSAR